MHTLSHRCRLWALWLSMAAAGPALAAGPADDDAAAAKAAVAAFHAALGAGDAEAALRLLAPDAVVLESGDVEQRHEYRDHHLKADIQFAQATQSTRTIVAATVQGDVAWVSASSTTAGSYKGKHLNLGGAELMVLSRSPTGWLIRAIHWSSRERK